MVVEVTDFVVASTTCRSTEEVLGAKFAPHHERLFSVPPSDISRKDPAEKVARYAMLLRQALPPNAVIRAHTNYTFAAAAESNDMPPGETPDSIRQVYQLPPIAQLSGTDGGSGVIVIVDAFDYLNAEADLNRFSEKFGLPACHTNHDHPEQGCLIIDSSSHPAPADSPDVTCGWGGEAALDLQWAHAIAPTAKLVLVEARSDALDDLFAAVQIAKNYITSLGQGHGQISMSWGTDEWDSEATYDRYFPDGPTYFASSGDKGGVVIYPSASPKVIAVGGTSLTRDNNGQLVAITGWSGSGGGISRFEPKPSFQNSVENLHGANRNAPDISADADPQSGVAVWLTTVCGGQQAGWQVIGGTSLASPMVAAMANASHHQRPSGAELTTIYANRPSISNTQRIRDVVGGDPAGGNETLVGYDNVTGVGEPIGLHFDNNR